MRIFSSRNERLNSYANKELLKEKIKVSVCENIPNTIVTKFISAVFSERKTQQKLRLIKWEDQFAAAREDVQYMLMQQALELGANALIGFKVSSYGGTTILVASADAVVVEMADKSSQPHN